MDMAEDLTAAAEESIQLIEDHPQEISEYLLRAEYSLEKRYVHTMYPGIDLHVSSCIDGYDLGITLARVSILSGGGKNPIHLSVLERGRDRCTSIPHPSCSRSCIWEEPGKEWYQLCLGDTQSFLSHFKATGDILPLVISLCNLLNTNPNRDALTPLSRIVKVPNDSCITCRRNIRTSVNVRHRSMLSIKNKTYCTECAWRCKSCWTPYTYEENQPIILGYKSSSGQMVRAGKICSECFKEKRMPARYGQRMSISNHTLYVPWREWNRNLGSVSQRWKRFDLGQEQL